MSGWNYYSLAIQGVHGGENPFISPMGSLIGHGHLQPHYHGAAPGSLTTTNHGMYLPCLLESHDFSLSAPVVMRTLVAP